MAKREPIVRRRPLQSMDKVTRELHALVDKELGVKVDPIKLRDFVCGRFHLLSAIVHELHEADQRGEFK